VHLTPEEVSALVLAASVARAVPGGGYQQIVDLAVKKLAFDLPEPPDTPVEFPPPLGASPRREPLLVHFPESEAKASREIGDRFSQLEAATRNRKRVTLRYRSASNAYVRTRDVDPYGLVYREGSWLLVGHCHLRTDVRSFRLDRILDLKVAPKPKSPDFERPESFDARAYANRSPWTFDSEAPEEVEIEIRPEAASTANEDFGAGAASERARDGSTTVRFSCGNPDYVVSRVLAAKGGIVVRRGERVRERLAAELSAVREIYR
jgi:proteasome accessory factor B